MYMLQEIDILEDWTAIKKVGAVLPAAGCGLAVWRLLSNQTSFGLCAGLTLGSSLVSLWYPLPSAQVPWLCLVSQTSFFPQPLSCSQADFDGLGGRKAARLPGSLTREHVHPLPRRGLKLPSTPMYSPHPRKAAVEGGSC